MCYIYFDLHVYERQELGIHWNIFCNTLLTKVTMKQGVFASCTAASATLAAAVLTFVDHCGQPNWTWCIKHHVCVWWVWTATFSASYSSSNGYLFLIISHYTCTSTVTSLPVCNVCTPVCWKWIKQIILIAFIKSGESFHLMKLLIELLD